MSEAIGPGSLVRCVDDTDRYPHLPGYWERPVVRGRLYTIRQVGVISQFNWRAGVRLVGIRRPHDAPLATDRFVPVDDGDIQIFRDLAANPKEKVRA